MIEELKIALSEQFEDNNNERSFSLNRDNYERCLFFLVDQGWNRDYIISATTVDDNGYRLDIRYLVFLDKNGLFFPT